MILRTPLVDAPSLGCALKLENLQRTGSFKLRGAVAKLRVLPPSSTVVVASAGNHGLGIACAAASLGHRATVVVSRASVTFKRRAIAAFGAEVIVSAGDYPVAEREARALAVERNGVFVSPFDDDAVIAGNGTSLFDEIRTQRPSVTRVIVPVGGGGLAAGMMGRGVDIIGVQPTTNCAMHDSIRDGHALVDYTGARTIAEGLEGAVAERTYALCRAMHIVLVDESDILDAVRWSFHTLGQRVEPSAAVVIAAIRSRKITVDANTVAVITGGNLDEDLL